MNRSSSANCGTDSDRLTSGAFCRAQSLVKPVVPSVLNLACYVCSHGPLTNKRAVRSYSYRHRKLGTEVFAS